MEMPSFSGSYGLIFYYTTERAEKHTVFPGFSLRKSNKKGGIFLYTLQKEKEFPFPEKSCMIEVPQNAYCALKMKEERYHAEILSDSAGAGHDAGADGPGFLGREQGDVSAP
ncbi:hypothetical protein KFE16_04030 [Clostridiaceae bacterium Marseille-Q4149]|jgi:hypothetical protein|nr:hypothetical protein KFE16_04030 [Clostridiaceae bacterium Marseille-Q4149]